MKIITKGMFISIIIIINRFSKIDNFDVLKMLTFLKNGLQDVCFEIPTTLAVLVCKTNTL